MKNFIKVIDAYDIEKVINIDFIQFSRKLLKLPSETKPSTRKTGRG